MDATVFLLVLGTALLHATWNALVKSDDDKLAVMGMIAITEALISLVLIPLVPLPSPESWPFLVVAVTLHVSYKLFLFKSYQHGDLSHVYPIARGSAPLIVALLSVVIVGEPLRPASQVGIVCIGIGIMSLAFTRDLRVREDRRALVYALVTGCLIASYTVVDGMGARAAGSPHGYMVWVTLFDAPPFLALCLFLRGNAVFEATRASWRRGIVAGVFSYAAFWTVIWALTLAPMAPVAALRETSILFAVLFGVVFLRESLNVLRLLAAGAVLTGAVLLRRQ
jgi:drug/metabolite transporter (DMT)-like permease